MKGKLYYAPRTMGQKFDVSRFSNGCLEKAMHKLSTKGQVRDANIKYKRKKQWRRRNRLRMCQECRACYLKGTSFTSTKSMCRIELGRKV